MSDALRKLITVLAVVGLPALAAAEDKQLVITSAHVDHSTGRLVISGQNLAPLKIGPNVNVTRSSRWICSR